MISQHASGRRCRIMLPSGAARKTFTFEHNGLNGRVAKFEKRKKKMRSLRKVVVDVASIFFFNSVLI